MQHTVPQLQQCNETQHFNNIKSNVKCCEFSFWGVLVCRTLWYISEKINTEKKMEDNTVDITIQWSNRVGISAI